MPSLVILSATQLRLDGRLVTGWLTGERCPRCEHRRLYVVAADATCCPACNVWIESCCPDPGCLTCESRPARPFRDGRPRRTEERRRAELAAVKARRALRSRVGP